MIKRKEFEDYKRAVEEQFIRLDKKIVELIHRMEVEKLKATLTAPVQQPVTDEEKKAAEAEVMEQNRKFAEWCEDAETLANLGFNKNS